MQKGKGMEIEELEERTEPLLPSQLTVAVAVNGTKNSKNALKWALEKFIPEGRIIFRLLYVRPAITMVPTPMGNYLPISKVREDVVCAYMKDVEMQTNSLLQPYKKICNQRKVEVESVIIEADDVAEAISADINKSSIDKLVIGASSWNIFTRKCSKMSSRISECIPGFCTLYVVSKGKLSSVHAASSGENASISGENERSRCESISSIASNSSSSHSSSGRSEWVNSETISNFSHTDSPSLSSQRNQALKVVNKVILDMVPSPGHKLHARVPSLSTDANLMSSTSNNSTLQRVNSAHSSYRSTQTDICSWNSDQASTSDILKNSSLSQNEVNVDFELERLRIKLRHLKQMSEIAQEESLDTSRELEEIRVRHEEEAARLHEMRMREEKARELAMLERERREAAEREAEYARECARQEAFKRKNAEDNAAREIAHRERLESALSCGDDQYKRYTWEEIEAATSSLSDDLKIGSGANGTVYKATFHHTTAAVKVLHSNEVRGIKQFKQELDILSRIRHPHLLLLLGACPDRGCLIYEYMENGSLEDRLQCKNNTPPIPWPCRYRIAWEIASALAFLHNSKPDPIIHRDLKPANILLDNNLVSKIGDVGLCTLLPAVNLAKSTIYMDTAPVGTLSYIDPEYQRTGQLSPKSDTYALGMVILQLLTGKPPVGVAPAVETALERGSLADVLDSGAGQWPVEETQELALLGLSCMEMRRKDRPDLKDEVLPVLERLRDFAQSKQDKLCRVPADTPGHFICPILQEVMEDPCVASDGYTYERRAIERWFRMNDKSPLTNVKLPDKGLIPNYSLSSAINEWKARNK